MHDPHTPTAIIAQTLQQAFPSRGEWKNWQPMADHILARLIQAGFEVVPVHQQDRRLNGPSAYQAQSAGSVLPFAPPSMLMGASAESSGAAPEAMSSS